MKYKKISIDSDKLEKLIDDNFPSKTRNDILPYLSILVTLVLTKLTTANFKSYGEYLTGTQISILFNVAIAFVVGLILYKIFSKPQFDKEKFVDLIEEESINISKDVILFLFIKSFKEGDNTDSKILFLYDKEWEMYMLPHCKVVKEYDSEKLSFFIENQLSLTNKSVFLTKVDELSIQEEKNSITYGKMTYYNYTTFFSSCEAFSEQNEKEFSIGNRKYKWLNLNEVKEHSKTMYLNKKLVLAIDDNWSNLLMNYKLATTKDMN